MTGYFITSGGETWQLPPLLSWEVQRTDGDPCDSAEITFLLEPSRLEELKNAVRLRLTVESKTVFFGVVDEFEVSAGAGGRRVTLTARSLAALLMDSELRAAVYNVLTLGDALASFVQPCGVTKVETDELPAVRQFSVDTGTTCWQALCGFCRHSADLRPRFAADGTLLLKRRQPQRWTLGADCGFETAVYRQCRYGVISRQTIVFSRGAAETVENAPLLEAGITARRVTMRRGSTLNAQWRTAQQRIEDAARDAVLLTVTLPAGFDAEPDDLVQVALPQLGVDGSFKLRAVTERCENGKRVCILELEGTLV